MNMGKFLVLSLLLMPALYAQILTVPNGGTGQATFTLHGPLVGNGTGGLTSGAPGTAGQCWISNGASADPSFQACPSGGGGGGTVTTFSATNLAPLFSTTVATPTTTPALSFTLSNAAANTLFGNFTGSSAGPLFNTIAACGDATHALSYVSGTGFGCQALSGGGGGVTSVGLSAPTNVFLVTGSPVTSSGTINLGFQQQSAKSFLAGPQAGTTQIPLLVQSQICTSTTTTTVSCAFTNPVQSGSLLIAYTYGYNTGISDTLSQTFVTPSGITWMYYKLNTAAGAETITLTTSGGNVGLPLIIAEYQGVNAFDANAPSNNIGSGSLSFPALTTGNATDLIFAGWSCNATNIGTFTPGSPFTMGALSSASAYSAGFMQTSTTVTGAITPTATTAPASCNGFWHADTIAFKNAPSTSSATPVFRQLVATDLPTTGNALRVVTSAGLSGASGAGVCEDGAGNLKDSGCTAGGGGITSINGNTTAAQVIAGTAPISVSSSAGTTTISSSALRSINTDSTTAQVLAAGTGISIVDNGTGTHTFSSAPANPVANITGATYTVTAADFSICALKYVTAGAITVTLPINTSQPPNGQCIILLNYGNGVMTVARNGQNINGAAANVNVSAATSGAQPNSAVVWSDGTNYEMTRGNSSYPFAQVTAGTNTAALVIGAGGTLGFSGTGAIVEPLINQGVNNNGGGLKHVRVTSCTTSAATNGSCGGNITWSPGFADAFYTISCTLNAPNAAATIWLSGPTAGTVPYTMYNLGANAAATTGTLECIAIHD